MSRALAFSDPEVIRLVAEQGHYGGVTIPSDSRQGQYACTPDGQLLGSVNCHDAPTMLKMMQDALSRWRALRSTEAPAAPAAPTALDSAPFTPDPRYVRRPPEGGLILRAFTRDLPRSAATPAKRTLLGKAVNHNYVWLTTDEAASLVPDAARPGATKAVPDTIARRLARYHMIDVVRGGTPMWRRDQVRHAEMTTTVEEATEAGIRLRLEGRFRCEEEGTWAVRPFNPPMQGQRRGLDTRLLGHATWNPEARRFTAFEALAVGDRWGGSEHNQRWDDLDPAPIAVLFDLADGTAPGDATPPDGYGGDYWKA